MISTCRYDRTLLIVVLYGWYGFIENIQLTFQMHYIALSEKSTRTSKASKIICRQTSIMTVKLWLPIIFKIHSNTSTTKESEKLWLMFSKLVLAKTLRHIFYQFIKNAKENAKALKNFHVRASNFFMTSQILLANAGFLLISASSYQFCWKTLADNAKKLYSFWNQNTMQTSMEKWVSIFDQNFRWGLLLPSPYINVLTIKINFEKRGQDQKRGCAGGQYFEEKILKCSQLH